MNIPAASVQPRPDQAKSGKHWSYNLVWIGGNVFGGMVAADMLVDLMRHRSFAIDSSNALAAFGVVFGMLVLPIVVTCFVPRKSFSWAAAALGIGLTWTILAHLLTFRQPATSERLKDDLIISGCILLFLCGPISLIRLFVRRGRDRKARRSATQQALMQQVPETTAGVWPPPVRIDGYYEDKGQP